MADDWSDIFATTATAKKDDWSDIFVSEPKADATLGGLAKAGGTGLVKGALGMADFAVEALPMTKGLRQAGFLPQSIAQTGADVLDLHKPENRAERFAETGGEFLSGAAAGGVGGLVGRGVKALLGGLATEGAGQTAEALGASEGVQKLVRLATSVGAPVAIQKASRPIARTPTRPELETETSANYNTMRQSGAEYTPQSGPAIVGQRAKGSQCHRKPACQRRLDPR
jgi:hypothetical protein